ncbi:MAG: hypothetical protein K2L49_06435, partial [Muribaculaceae bacterium]|nr:hypothetical protein [Muribaculaceae bacterium]
MMTRNLPLLAAAHRAYCADADLRRRRTRYKHFTYGRQWDDTVTDSDGTVLTEGELASRSGRVPLTNNLIRQLVKTIVGRFRQSLTETASQPQSETALRNQLDELDSRLLEEFLISGCAIQKLSHECRHGTTGWWIDNINPARFFVDRRDDPRSTDIELAGVIHDMSLPELLARFSGGDRAKAMQLRRLYGSSADTPFAAPAGTAAPEFFTALPGRCRVIETWTLDSREVLRCHDQASGDYYLAPASEAGRIEAANRRRHKSGKPGIASRWEISARWHCRHMAPDGTVIAEQPSAMADGGHPFVMKFYPLTDGEIHPFVEDVIDQQKYVNRL